MGPGEDYWHDWAKWFHAMPSHLQDEYRLKWAEPNGWTGFYEFIVNGTTPPWLVKQREVQDRQRPPETTENRIEDPDRVRWMGRRYLTQTNGRDPNSAKWAPIYVGPDGDFWKLCESHNAPFFWERVYDVIGPDNTRDSVRAQNPIN
jgi:hypothetical protein